MDIEKRNLFVPTNRQTPAPLRRRSLSHSLEAKPLTAEVGPGAPSLFHRAHAIVHLTHPILHVVHGACCRLGFVLLTGRRFFVTAGRQGEQKAKAAQRENE